MAQGYSSIRKFCFKVTKHKSFDLFIMICILANTFLLGFNWYMQPESFKTPIEIVNYVFMTIFTLEAIVKILAQRTYYFKDSWNVFDFIIVVMTIIILSLNWAGIGEKL